MIPDKLKSRKLWVTVVTAAICALAQQLGLPETAAEHVAEVVSVYLVAQAAHDIALVRKSP